MFDTIIEFIRNLPSGVIWAVVIIGVLIELYFMFFRKKKGDKS